jgi:hypothetical protein
MALDFGRTFWFWFWCGGWAYGFMSGYTTTNVALYI